MRGGGRDVEDRWRGGRYGYGYGYDDEARRPSYRGRGPKNYTRSDERSKEDVCEWLQQDDHVDASDIEVHVSEGVVTLTGSIDDRMAKRRAEDIAESVTGVKDVQNQVRVSRERENR